MQTEANRQRRLDEVDLVVELMRKAEEEGPTPFVHDTYRFQPQPAAETNDQLAQVIELMRQKGADEWKNRPVLRKYTSRNSCRIGFNSASNSFSGRTDSIRMVIEHRSVQAL